MRLKGGKVLLDLTGYGSLDDVEIIDVSLTAEEVKSIMEKGVSVKVKSGTSNVSFLVDLLPKYLQSDFIYYYPIYNANQDEFIGSLDIELGSLSLEKQ